MGETVPNGAKRFQLNARGIAQVEIRPIRVTLGPGGGTTEIPGM